MTSNQMEQWLHPVLPNFLVLHDDRPDNLLQRTSALHLAGTIDLECVVSLFLHFTVHARITDEPGFLSLDSAGSFSIPIYSTSERLLSAEGSCNWYACTGFEMICQIPRTHSVIIDWWSPTELEIPPSAFVVSDIHPDDL